MFTLGDAFLAGEQVHGTHHLWLIINDPAAHQNTALFVNITTLSAIAELTCVLKPGEHPFVKHDSWIRFASAKTAAVAELDTLESKGLILRQPAASSALIQKIRAGAATSPLLPQKFLCLL
jgi:hypothetical protein